MAQHSKQPEVLRELFEALRNDPFVIAECLARPALSKRLLTNWYPYDQRIHGELKQRAEGELQTRPAVEQMKQLSGTYNEMELIRTDSVQGTESRGSGYGVRLNSREWDQAVRRLTEVFRNGENGTEAIRAPQIGVSTPLQEDETRYYVTALIKKTDDHLSIATVTWSKEPLESWLARAGEQIAKTMPALSANYTLPAISDGAGCEDDTWSATAAPPDARFGHTAVWTGGEMIIWGGYDGSNDFNSGYRYDPATDTWTATSAINAPTAREYHTAIWTGTQMIVWGGSVHDVSYPNTGGRYNPSTDNWIATSTTNAPTGRYDHTAVWSGSDMIVWGGYNGSELNTGGKYNPNTDNWTATSTSNAPAGRFFHTAVWTGSAMIVWGGYSINVASS